MAANSIALTLLFILRLMSDGPARLLMSAASKPPQVPAAALSVKDVPTYQIRSKIIFIYQHSGEKKTRPAKVSANFVGVSLWSAPIPLFFLDIAW